MLLNGAVMAEPGRAEAAPEGLSLPALQVRLFRTRELACIDVIFHLLCLGLQFRMCDPASRRVHVLPCAFLAANSVRGSDFASALRGEPLYVV